MRRITAPMVAPKRGQISAYTSGTQLTLSMRTVQDCDFPPDEGRVGTDSGE